MTLTGVQVDGNLLHLKCINTLIRNNETISIQSDSRGICSTLGNDSMCDSMQKSSYEHGSDFKRLPR